MFNRLNPEARIAVMQATDVARQLGHTEVGPDHVLLGLLANVRGETYALLNTHGLDFDSARTIVIDRHPVSEATPQQTDSGTETDQSAAELDEDRAALRAIGIDLDKVREAVRSAFGDDITAEWGERSRRGRGRGRGGPEGRRGRGGPRGHHHHRHHDRQVEGAADGEPGEDPEGGAPEEPRGRGGRGRRGPRSERFGERAAFSESLRDTLRDTVREARLGHADLGVPQEDRRGPGGGRLTAGLLLLAISRSDDPAVEAVLASASDPDELRAAIAEASAQPVS